MLRDSQGVLQQRKILCSCYSAHCSIVLDRESDIFWAVEISPNELIPKHVQTCSIENYTCRRQHILQPWQSFSILLRRFAHQNAIFLFTSGQTFPIRIFSALSVSIFKVLPYIFRTQCLSLKTNPWQSSAMLARCCQSHLRKKSLKCISICFRRNIHKRTIFLAQTAQHFCFWHDMPIRKGAADLHSTYTTLKKNL